MQPTSTPANGNDAHYDQVLRDLVDMATDIARVVHTQITQEATHGREAATAALPPTHKPANDQSASPILVIAFDRIARTIRRTVLLAKKLPSLAGAQHTAPTTDPGLRRIASRKRILRQVEDVIQRDAKPDHLDALQTELRERLDSPDLEDDIDHRPIQDIVADICRDLRVPLPYATNYKRRTPADVAALRAQAAALPDSWRETKPGLPPEIPPNPRARPRRRPNDLNLYTVGYEESRNREGLG